MRATRGWTVGIVGVLAAWFAMGASGPMPPEAEPMLVLLEWEHPYPAEVSYFRVHFSDSAPGQGSPTTALEVGLPGAQGRYSWSLTVQPDQPAWVAVEAVGPTGLVSPLSEWRLYEWKAGGGELGMPGRPVLVEGS